MASSIFRWTDGFLSVEWIVLGKLVIIGYLVLAVIGIRYYYMAKARQFVINAGAKKDSENVKKIRFQPIGANSIIRMTLMMLFFGALLVGWGFLVLQPRINVISIPLFVVMIFFYIYLSSLLLFPACTFILYEKKKH